VLAFVSAEELAPSGRTIVSSKFLRRVRWSISPLSLYDVNDAMLLPIFMLYTEDTPDD
jgi:hypothetical protein